MDDKYQYHSNRFLYLLLALLAFFVFDAIIADEKLNYVSSIVFSILMLAGLYSVGHHNRPILIAAVISGLSAMSVRFSTSILQLGHSIDVIQFSLSLIFCALITATTLHHTLQYRRVTIGTLYGATCTYLLIGLSWSFAYELIVHVNPLAFTGTTSAQSTNQFTYYSFVTLTTLGYGDIVPQAQMAKLFAWLEAVVGQIYLTVLIAQLVGLYISQKHSRSD